MRTPSTAPAATFGLEPAGYRRLLEQLAHASHILVYSGAGMSADSGLPTYRGGGEHLWSGDLLERVATPAGYARDPAFAIAWYVEQAQRQWSVTHLRTGSFSEVHRMCCRHRPGMQSRAATRKAVRCRGFSDGCPRGRNNQEVCMRNMQNAGGWTIVQIMAALLIAGVVAAVAVEVIIDKRCEADPARSICADRS